jgi:Polyketide cyclase / dehydrase and lipid transport
MDSKGNGKPRQGIRMIIQAEVDIHAPLPVVWRVFSHLDDWKDWNTACNSCRFIEGDAITDGACFTFVVKPIIFPVRVEPRVVSCTPGREVVWEGERLGIRAVHTWRFREHAQGVLLESVETFKGPLLALGRLVGVPKRLHHLTVLMLDQIKRHSEACSAAPSFETTA